MDGWEQLYVGGRGVRKMCEDCAEYRVNERETRVLTASSQTENDFTTLAASASDGARRQPLAPVFGVREHHLRVGGGLWLRALWLRDKLLATDEPSMLLLLGILFGGACLWLRAWSTCSVMWRLRLMWAAGTHLRCYGAVSAFSFPFASTSW